MPRSYTANQTGAIACWLAFLVWGLTAYAAAIMLGKSSPLYGIVLVVGWIILLFCIMLISHVFIAGIFWLAFTMCYLMITPSLLGTTAWYTLSRGLFDFTYVVAYMFMIAIIYFSYKSWKELQKTV